MSDRKPLFSDFNQCHSCDKSKTQGATLFRCAGCLFGLYCSKECQKKAWPEHKSRCKLNQKTRKLALDNYDSKLLSSFMDKHRVTLTAAALSALDIRNRPESAKSHGLLVLVRQRPAKHAEHAYLALDAGVVPLDDNALGGSADEIKEEALERKRTGVLGVFLIIVRDVDSNLRSIVPVEFHPPLLTAYNERKLWKEWMIKKLNQGVSV
ncbi:hypothetical protein BDN72DRAFT_805649 [Pluteus cervinus]|uniref:Uncharacterized protein n=1 Tax=Pluteus cervinus TaxID=181527 RepID=A0ACD3A4P6_9AGAR|nr:hypothetical protein BDN72DRAFT_805649 [Pluteus cervinus]